MLFVYFYCLLRHWLSRLSTIDQQKDKKTKTNNKSNNQLLQKAIGKNRNENNRKLGAALDRLAAQDGFAHSLALHFFCTSLHLPSLLCVPHRCTLPCCFCGHFCNSLKPLFIKVFDYYYCCWYYISRKL